MLLCKDVLSSTDLIGMSWMRKQKSLEQKAKIIYFAIVPKRNGRDHSWHHFGTRWPTPPSQQIDLVSGVFPVCTMEEFYWKVSPSPPRGFPFRCSGRSWVSRARKSPSLPGQDAQGLAQFLCKEMSTAAMLSPIRKTLRCNQAFPGGQGFGGIDALPPYWLLFGQICNLQCSLPSLSKTKVTPCSEVQHPEHRMTGAASLEPRQSQGSLPWSISLPVSFVERAGFLLDPQRSVTKGGVIWTLDNDHSVFNETQTHMDHFFLNAFSVGCPQQWIIKLS